jgi:hypothetical protein
LLFKLEWIERIGPIIHGDAAQGSTHEADEGEKVSRNNNLM